MFCFQARRDFEIAAGFLFGEIFNFLFCP